MAERKSALQTIADAMPTFAEHHNCPPERLPNQYELRVAAHRMIEALYSEGYRIVDYTGGSNRRRTSSMQKGDRVAYSRKFLRNTGQFTGWASQARGVVLHTEPFGHAPVGKRNAFGHMPFRHSAPTLCTIKWDGMDDVSRVLDVNLVLEHKIATERV